MELKVNPVLETIDWKKVFKLFRLVNCGIRNPLIVQV